MKYNHFQSIDEFMIRFPFRNEERLNLDEESVLEFCKDCVFQEQILIASHNLYATMITYINNPKSLSVKQKRDFLISIRKYMVRSVTRTTPFGLFSAVGTGSFSKETQLSIDTDKIHKSVYADTQWLFKLVEKLESEYKKQIRFSINQACMIKGNRVCLLYTTDGKRDEISIRVTPLFNLIYNACKDYTYYVDMVSLIHDSYQDASEEKISGYLTQLILKGLLISDLRPPMSNTSDTLNYLISKLDFYGITGETTRLLVRTNDLICQYRLAPVGTGLDLYQETLQVMKEIQPESVCLQVDLHSASNAFALDTQSARQIEKTVGFLVDLCKSESSHARHMEAYKSRFLEKYGYEREVPILELLDPIIGIGAPVSYQQPPSGYDSINEQQDTTTDKLPSYFLQKYCNALIRHCNIEITEEEIKPYLPTQVSKDTDPSSLEIYLMPRLVNDSLYWNISPVVGADKAGKTFGRFSNADPQFGELLKRIAQYKHLQQTDSYETCSFNYLPGNMRSGNVVREINSADKEITLSTTPSRLGHQLVLSDVVVGIDHQDRFYMVDLINNKIINACTNNMFNPYLQPNAVRLMQEITDDHTVSWGQFPWVKAYRDFDYVPRITYRNFILSGARWKVTAEQLGIKPDSVFEDFISVFNQFSQEYNLPDYLYISYEDNRLKINTRDSYSLEILFAEIKNSKAGFLMLEEVEAGENIIVDEGGRSHCCEIVVPLINNDYQTPEIERIVPYADIARDDRTKLPFQGWLYFNLYTTQSREEEMIAFEIPGFFESAAYGEDVNYFFIRYNDPVPHIRLRISGAENILQQLSIKLFAWMGEILNNQLISGFSIVPYDREIERYGGKSLISTAEDFFAADSQAISAFLRMSRMSETEYSLEELCIISLLYILNEWFDNWEEMLGFLTLGYESREFNVAFKKNKAKLLEVCDIELDWTSLKSDENAAVFETLKQYCGPIQTIKLRFAESAGTTNTLNGILSSILHMHCNRMLGTERLLEQKVMAFCEKIIYAKKYFLKQKRIGA
ncbi:MAG: hypothetical protein K0R23_626 [Lacrimispora sp.]|nr:hypothetical protein [Lacrimispora sp.]